MAIKRRNGHIEQFHSICLCCFFQKNNEKNLCDEMKKQYRPKMLCPKNIAAIFLGEVPREQLVAFSVNENHKKKKQIGSQKKYE
jgi:hypothetical protein